MSSPPSMWHLLARKHVTQHVHCGQLNDHCWCALCNVTDCAVIMMSQTSVWFLPHCWASSKNFSLWHTRTLSVDAKSIEGVANGEVVPLSPADYLGSMEEHHKLPQWNSGQSPGQNWFFKIWMPMVAHIFLKMNSSPADMWKIVHFLLQVPNFAHW